MIRCLITNPSLNLLSPEEVDRGDEKIESASKKLVTYSRSVSQPKPDQVRTDSPGIPAKTNPKHLHLKNLDAIRKIQEQAMEVETSQGVRNLNELKIAAEHFRGN